MIRRILLVEDERIVALDEMNTLRKNGYDVLWAADAQEAEARMASESAISLVLMDIDLGNGSDGTVAAERILATRDVPVVFLTSHSDQETVEQVRDLAGYGYVVKDSGSFVLLETVRMALELFDAHARSRENEVQYRALFESAVDPIVVYDKQATVIMANESAARIADTTREAMVGRRIEEIYPDRYEEEIERVRGCLRENKTLVFSESLTLKTGATRLYQSKYRPLRLAGYPEPLVQLLMIELPDELSDDIGFDNASILPAITRNAPGFVFQLLLRPDGTHGFPYVSESIARYFGYTAIESMNDPQVLLQAVPEVDRQRVIDHVFGSARTLQPYSITHRLTTRDGDEKWLKAQASPDERDDGSVVWTGICIDVTEEHRATMALAEREAEYRRLAERYQFLTETTGEIVCLHDSVGAFQYVSPSVKEILGYEPETLIGLSPDNLLHPEDQHIVENEAYRRLLQGVPIGATEYRIRHRDGYYLWFETSTDVTMDKNNQLVGIITKSRDISARKNDEQRIQKALSEQEFLVREMNHRIKNNLAMVRSLVELKQGSAKGSVDLSDLVSRIEAIRILHEMMHKSDTSKLVDIKGYLSNLVSAAISAVGSEQVHRELSIEPLLLPADTALPLALIVNEVVTNAVKYGFPQADHPEFRLELGFKNDECVVTLSNTGPAIPSSAFSGKPGGLGLRLIQVLAEQIGAELTISKSENPTFTLRFTPSVEPGGDRETGVLAE
ncbi:MAG: PAS domain S-box protein [Spirochaetales bacterium]